MAYTINWITKVITIPLSDLTLVSGVNYTLTTDDAHKEIRRLEWEFADGLWAIYAIDYTNTQVLSGIAYSPVIKLVNGYTWFADASNINISLLGSNSNLLDTFIPGNGVSVLANNSGGKIVAGGGLSPEQDATLTQIDDNVLVVDGKVDIIDSNVDAIQVIVTAIDGKVDIIDTNIDNLGTLLTTVDGKIDVIGLDVEAIQLEVTDIWQAHYHRRVWNKISKTITIYQVDNLTPKAVFDTNADLSDITPQ